MRDVRSDLRPLGRPCRVIGRAALLGAWVLASVLAPVTATATPTWTMTLGSASHGQAKGDVVPAAPGGDTATCSGLIGNAIVVNWSAVVHASNYQVMKSATSGGTYTLAATVTQPTTTWTGTFSSGTYFFKVKALAGTNWASPMSAPTSQRNISLILVCT